MDIKKFVSTKEDGTIEIDSNAFQREFDAEVSRAVETFKKGKGREEIRKELEEEAKLTAEEKLKQEREEFEKYKLQSVIELNQAKARAKLEGKNFSEKEMGIILSTVNNDEKASLSKIDELISEREQLVAQTKKSAIESLQQGQTNVNTILTNPDSKQPQQDFKWTRDDIFNAYRPQQK